MMETLALNSMNGVFLVPLWNAKSSRSQMFFGIDVLKNFTRFTRKHLCWNLFLIKLQTLLKKESNTVFSWEYWESFKNSFFIEWPRLLLLKCLKKFYNPLRVFYYTFRCRTEIWNQIFYYVRPQYYHISGQCSSPP